MPIHDLSNKVVLITGIGSVGEGWGNGTTIATLFARQGAIVFGCDINLDAAKRAAEKMNQDPEIVDHPSRTKGSDSPAVEVLQQSIVSNRGEDIMCLV
jgi:NAD(P)-dependent dehydrogenase (short-subunit alcohol dehydrogenase family)